MRFSKLKIWLPLSLKSKHSWITLISAGLFILCSIIPLRLAIALHHAPTPQAILVLGGEQTRMKSAAQFWHSHSNLEIWVSDYYRNFAINSGTFHKLGVPEERLHYDFCATDTVTNFTCTVSDFLERKFYHLYLLTSDYHITRAKAIATIVLGSRGIFVTPVPVPSEYYQKESFLRVLRDCLRSLLWIVTGRTGASLNPRLND